jgi:hypothetical protein
VLLQVLALMVALGLTHPRDVASFAAASTRCKAVCAAAPLRLAVTTRSSSPSEEQAEARRNVGALCVSWPGTAELDLTGSPLENCDVLAALAALPALERLQLDRCKKITPELARILQQRSEQHPQLRVVTLQRCFQLSSAALTHVLAARLSCAALSHLSLDKWPAEEAALPRSQLRMLALHNCGKLGSAALQGIAAACPELEVLMLGGGSFLLEEELPACGEAGGSAADTTVSTASTQPPSADGERLHQAALAAVLQGSPALGAAFSIYVAGVATQLALMARKLPKLHVLELTFGLPQLVPALQHLALNEVRLPPLGALPFDLCLWGASLWVCTALPAARLRHRLENTSLMRAHTHNQHCCCERSRCCWRAAHTRFKFGTCAQHPPSLRPRSGGGRCSDASGLPGAVLAPDRPPSPQPTSMPFCAPPSTAPPRLDRPPCMRLLRKPALRSSNSWSALVPWLMLGTAAVQRRCLLPVRRGTWPAWSACWVQVLA